ncbi:titin [Lutzomyia longipalpis]|uniref:titin n=1 Tax=Lutzomyia longipalpis TaxID=7200 RepID=UPI002483B14E|nr:titin [Lutzomyia longipalpis]
MDGKRYGGRTSSQISIYDYPEHLNPFYEDEQHKRLRFWKIGKKSDKVKRSNSFSLDGFRELWTLKSFRLKKKSSTLGINKTSESPPPLRRTLMVEEHDPERAYHTLDPSSRHTVSVGLNNNFQRSARYRSSLQDMSTLQQSSPFNRSDKYRNTMQNGQEFTNRGLRSPQYSGGSTGNHLVHSSSQQSLSSTNPFDEGENQASTSGSSTGGVKKPARKKRRAPPPPTPKITPQSSGNNEPEKVQENIEPEQAVAISNLTAEIESFVKKSDSDDSKECGEISIPVPAPRREKREAPKFEVTKTVDECEITLRITESTDDLTHDVGRENVEKKSPEREKEVLKVVEKPQEVIKQPEEVVEKPKEVVEKPKIAEKPKELPVAVKDDVKEVKELKIEEVSREDQQQETVYKENGQVVGQVKMTEKSDPYKNVVVEMEKYEIRFSPLKTNDDREGEHRKNPVERQRSVQEIIESINKNQSLLRINYEDDTRVQNIMHDIETQKLDAQRRKSADSLSRNIQELEVKEREMRELIRELEEQQEAYEIPVPVQEFNNNSFSKCVQLRDPEARDQNDNQTQRSSIEWNPLPKPRRSRNLSMEDADVPPT